jgi:hypothetical protein
VLTKVSVGPGPDFETGESHIPEDEITFIAQQTPKAKYMMSSDWEKVLVDIVGSGALVENFDMVKATASVRV